MRSLLLVPVPRKAAQYYVLVQMRSKWLAIVVQEAKIEGKVYGERKYVSSV